ncbi:hypothetical protein AX16_003813 [Volvariella volvacea WC 439]|nr:hypothetical protein AX16_003813 [Volvariella volvacea WC 439]
MNVKEISPDTLGALRTFFAIAVPLTLTTVWVIVAIQSHYMFEGEKDPPFRKRLIWPYFRLKRAYHKRKLRRQIRQRDIEEGHDRCGTEEDDTTLKEGEQK